MSETTIDDCVAFLRQRAESEEQEGDSQRESNPWRDGKYLIAEVLRELATEIETGDAEGCAGDPRDLASAVQFHDW